MIQAATKTKQFPKRPAQIKHNQLGPYTLLQTLGEGEYGKVKLGVHSQTGEENLNHPYIVKLYDVVETEKYVGLVLEYASGGELFEHILAHRYLKEKDAKKFFAQLISGIQYMHKCKIVHRDLKLENVLIEKNRNILITDFGFANQFSTAADDMMSTTCGSPCYAAPELVVNAGLYAGSAVDIWSCGVILFAMLCGFLPFDDDPSNPDGDDIHQLYRYIISTRLIFPSHVSLQARDLLDKMLVPDPAKRCTLDFVISHAWLDDFSDVLGREKKTSAEKSSFLRKAQLLEKNDRFAPVTNSGFLKSEKDWAFNDSSKPFRHGLVRSYNIPNFVNRKPIKEVRSPPTIPEVTTSTENQLEKSISTSNLSSELPKDDPLDFLSKSSKNDEADRSETSTIGNVSLITPCPTEESLTAKSALSRFVEKSSRSPSFSESGLTTSTHSSVSSKDNKVHRTSTISNRATTSAAPDQLFVSSSTSLISSGAQPDPEPTDSSRFTISAVRKTIYRKTKISTTESISPLNFFNKESSRHPRQSGSLTTQTQENKSEAKRKGKKVINWIKKRSKPAESAVKIQEIESQLYDSSKKKLKHTSDFIGIPETSSINRGRTQSTNGLAFMKTEETNTNIQIHQGPIDRTALTSRPPKQIMDDVSRILRILGIETLADKEDGVFALKCIRRKASKRKEEGLKPIYGEAAIDNGEEVRFLVEVCRFENLPGLFIVDVKRLKGNLWAYKFLYHKLIDFLDLNKSDYFSTIKTGGRNTIVQIDESKFAKRKHGRGNGTDGKWVLGGVEKPELKI
ncbi:kinase-like domain-containing protein [Sporodiniella umbellata]|nr:kinase-like domain-containing protein [Sporodiniella umbellata]